MTVKYLIASIVPRGVFLSAVVVFICGTLFATCINV